MWLRACDSASLGDQLVGLSANHVLLGCYPLKLSSHVRMQVVDGLQRPSWRQQYA